MQYTLRFWKLLDALRQEVAVGELWPEVAADLCMIRIWKSQIEGQVIKVMILQAARQIHQARAPANLMAVMQNPLMHILMETRPQQRAPRRILQIWYVKETNTAIRHLIMQ